MILVFPHPVGPARRILFPISMYWLIKNLVRCFKKKELMWIMLKVKTHHWKRYTKIDMKFVKFSYIFFSIASLVRDAWWLSFNIVQLQSTVIQSRFVLSNFRRKESILFENNVNKSIFVIIQRKFWLWHFSSIYPTCSKVQYAKCPDIGIECRTEDDFFTN